ncbi:MAG: hypothetical protein PWP65_30 [Clostridia bacterium]|nr:hypothetical protein [Clostridia bacterium]
MKPRKFTLVSGKGRLRVWGNIFLVPGGIILHLFGGERPHLGAVAIGLPRPSLSGSGRSSTTSVYAFLGHKDDEVARPAASRLAAELGLAAVVLAGVHVEGAAPGEIAVLARRARQVTSLAIKVLKGRNIRLCPRQPGLKPSQQ